MFVGFVGGLTAGAEAGMWVLCYFGTLMSCIEPPVQHLACEVSGRSVEAFEGYAETLHVNVVPDRIKFPGFPSFLKMSAMFGSVYVKSN